MFEMLKRVALALLAPNIENERKELAARRGYMPRTWHRIMRDNQLAGFAFICKCGTEYRVINFADWLHAHRCNTCRSEFSLLKDCGITPKTPHARWAAIFNGLPVRATLPPTQARAPFLDTWANSDGEVEWTGTGH